MGRSDDDGAGGSDADAARLAAIGAVLPGRWDREALTAGASVCLVMAIPFRILAGLVGGDSGGANALLFVVFLFFFVVGSGCAAWVQRSGTPLSHALVTAIGTYVISEIVFVVIRLVRGSDVPWGTIPLVLSMVSLCGVIGGFLGNRLQTQGIRPSSQR